MYSHSQLGTATEQVKNLEKVSAPTGFELMFHQATKPFVCFIPCLRHLATQAIKNGGQYFYWKEELEGICLL